MNLRAALGEAHVQLAPLDPDELSVPERALLPEWANERVRRKEEARKAALAEAERRRKEQR